MELQPQVGFFWHMHHDILLEWCYGYDERKAFIINNKDKSEQELRLKLCQPVKGALPQEVVEAWQAYEQAWRAYDQAWQAREQALRAYARASLALDRASLAFNRALFNNKHAIDELHEKECPNCPWNGYTIFP